MGMRVAKEEPLVSIVTPSFNQARYIEETILSVLNQDYPNLEYIVIDGGSSDHTAEILKKYESCLTWISEKDRGQADAINKGFRMANGEILAWLNSDDTYRPGAIRQAVRYFEAHPEVGMVYGEGYHIDERGDILERYYTEDFDYQRLSEICFICQPTVFMRADAIGAVGPLDLSLDYCLDYEYWMRIAKRFRIGYIPVYLANSRLHTDTKTLSKRLEVHQQNLQVVKRHYGEVPVRWINAYAHVLLTEKLLRRTQGIYEDGWASPDVTVSLPRDGEGYAYLSLQGICTVHAQPLRLEVALDGQVLEATVIRPGRFSLTVPLCRDDVFTSPREASEITLSTEKSFVPDITDTNGDMRTLAYRVKKLSVHDGRGRELIFFAGRKRWLFAFALPFISLEKSLALNHRICSKELWHTTRDLWGDLIKTLANR
jgi:glycosyltransferase involved in cell wall biosynthesis